jgi:hypothetical protein
LAQHLLAKSQFAATAMAVDRDRLKQQYYQEQTAKQIAQTYVIQ